MTTPTNASTHPSTLSSLRSLTPGYQLDLTTALSLAERQATRLRLLLLAPGEALDEHHLAALPRLRIVRDSAPTSGLSYWSGTEWVIVLRSSDSAARQRFTLLHEYKHIIDHGVSGRLYQNAQQAERIADYFAGCALVPKAELKRVFCSGLQRLHDLADHFGVSPTAIQVRLDQTDPWQAAIAAPARSAPHGDSASASNSHRTASSL
jgi:Zn-dependent peptidase ImmA (M78 family)